jgi:hypothetical protein
VIAGGVGRLVKRDELPLGGGGEHLLLDPLGLDGVGSDAVGLAIVGIDGEEIDVAGERDLVVALVVGEREVVPIGRERSVAESVVILGVGQK